MDIWRLGIVEKSLRDVIDGGFGAARVRWIGADRPFAFLADPFGMWHDERIFVFAEAYDYRTRLGHIEVLEFDRSLRLVDKRPCLKMPWHLSYPFVFQTEGETWMLPEAYRSGRLKLYRCFDFPHSWKAECIIDLPEIAVDATPFHHDGLWWLFYSPANRAGPVRLHAAFAETLKGPWFLHPMNPLVQGPRGSRPAGTPLVIGEQIILPVQDCDGHYGSGINVLRLEDLTTNAVEIVAMKPLPAPATSAPFCDGFHTLSAAGDVTLIDVKRIEHSVRRWPIDALGRGRRAARRWFPPSR